MLNLTLTETNGTRIPVSVPLSWDDVTLGTYAKLIGKEQNEQVAILLGLPIERFRQVRLDHLNEMVELMEFIYTPITEEVMQGFTANVGLESIGQLELAKKFITAHEDGTIWDVAPYILAIYLWPDRYSLEDAFASLSGFPSALVIEAQALPITKAYGATLFFSMNYAGFRQHLAPYLVESLMQTRPQLA